MSLVDRNLRQAATLWTFNGVDNAGDPAFATPAAITVRWEDRTVEFIDARGEKSVSRSVVYLSQDVARGDFMLLGTSVATDPTAVVGAFMVRDFRKIPSVNATEFERRALLGAGGGG